MITRALKGSTKPVVFRPIGIIRILDGSPLLDIKPFVPRFDIIEGARGGWTEAVDDPVARERGRRGFSR